jgi:competence protein ComEC
MRLCLVSSILALIVSIHMHSGINPIILVFLAGTSCALILTRYCTVAGAGGVSVLILLSALLSVGYSQYWLEDQMTSRLPVALSGIKVSGVARVIDCDYSNPQVEKLRLKLISLNTTEPQVKRLEEIVVNHYLLNRKQSRSARSEQGAALKKRLGCNKVINFSAKLRAPYSFINPYGFDYEAWQLSRGVDATGYLLSYEVQVVDKTFSAWFIEWRQQGIVRAAALPGKAGQIIPALLFGESGYLDKDAWLDLQITGTVHLLIVSGLHVSFLILLVMLIWRQLIRLEMLLFSPSYSYVMRLTPVVLLFSCLLYCYMAGMGLAVQRSGLMLMVAILISFSRYHWSLFDSWLWVMWMVLIINPMVSLFVGFWFSFFAVGALLLGHAGIVRTFISSAFSDRVRVLYRPQWIIFLALLPLLWLFQQPSSFFSFFVNILAIPLLAFVILPLSLICFATVDANVLILFNTLLEFLLVSLHKLSLLSSWLVFKPSGLWVFILIPLTGFALLFKGFPFKVLSLLLLVVVFFLPMKAKDDTLLVFDVGQGLAVYGKLGSSQKYDEGVSWLYDTGAKFRSGFSLGDAVVAKNILALTGNQLDILFISHSDNDHAGGEAGLLRKVRVKTTYAGQPERGFHKNCHNLSNEWQLKKGLKWRVFNPTGLELKRLSDNNLSCIVQIEMSGQRILIPGDAERKIERALVDQFGEELQSDILLVGHHGSKTSSSEDFIRAVSPKMAVVSSGLNNPFRHPHQAVIDRFKRLSIPVYNTALSGAIEIKLDKKPTVIEWRKEKPPIWRQL